MGARVKKYQAWRYQKGSNCPKKQELGVRNTAQNGQYDKKQSYKKHNLSTPTQHKKRSRSGDLQLLIETITTTFHQCCRQEDCGCATYEYEYICCWLTVGSVLSPPLFFHLTYHLLPSFSLSLLVVTKIQGHIATPSLPSPLRFVSCILIARRIQLLLPSSTRVELRLPTLGALRS